MVAVKTDAKADLKKSAIPCNHRACGRSYRQKTDAETDEKGVCRHEVLQNAGTCANPCKKHPIKSKNPVISDWACELIPGFEPGTSSLPKYMKGDCEGVSMFLFYVA